MPYTAEDGHEYLTDAEIAAAANLMSIADPDQDLGSFSMLGKIDMLVLLKLMGVNGLTPKSPDTEEDIREKLRLALWDSQRLDYIFHGKTFEGKHKLAVDQLPTWPTWRKSQMQRTLYGQLQLDGYRDADKLDSWVMRHFQMSVYSQRENMDGSFRNPPPQMHGAWAGARNIMRTLAEEITKEGGDKIPFVTFYSKGPQNGPKVPATMLVIQLVDVKEAPWPEPSEKEWKIIRECQETKFGHAADGPLVPMMRTPKMPVILMRYAYIEGRPKDGLQFFNYIQEQLEKKGMSTKKAREQIQFHTGAGFEVSEVHLRTLARILSANSTFMDQDYIDEQQSHWNGISRDVAKETRISFMAPCLRLRWLALEELETGVKPKKIANCSACGKEGCKLFCSSCKSVAYCGKEHNQADWPKHKEVCKISKRLGKSPRDLPEKTFYANARCIQQTVLDSGFVIEQEAIKQSATMASGDIAANVYGDERFILRIHRALEYAAGDLPQYKGQTVFMTDRRHSIFVRTGPGDVAVAKMRSNVNLPLDRAAWPELLEVVKAKGLLGQVIYLWAKRIGDCLEIDLKDIPEQKGLVWQ
ncbi:hypothetical protein PENSPDRAFT_647598 [Peniophora sp. CONT]|nr:hypothetical protein PENSPDRAFT_647598 [Peniophora sp. CONT]